MRAFRWLLAALSLTGSADNKPGSADNKPGPHGDCTCAACCWTR